MSDDKWRILACMLWDDFASCLRRFSASEIERIRQAFDFGEKAHAGQKRQSGDPYFTHPIAVATILADLGADADTIIAALLHDVVEDTEIHLPQIKRQFGTKVSMLIDGVTKLMEEEMVDKPTLDQKIETLRKIFTLMQEDVRIMVIKLADRLHNVRTLSFRPVEKQLAVAKETLDVYVKIADRLSMRTMRDALEEHCYAVVDPERYESMVALRRANATLAEAHIRSVKSALKDTKADLLQEIIFEPKSWGRLHLQYEMAQQSREQPVEINVVFLCKDEGACYSVLGAIHAHWPRIALTFNDFINVQAINGYQGIHTTVILEDGTRMRCKIRTEQMDRYAQLGIATTCFDNQAKGILDYLPWTQRLSPLTEDTKDRSEEFWQSLQSDILSESIEVYSSTHSVLVPMGATVLDTVLFLFPKEAFYLHEVFADGQKVSLSEPVQRAWRIDITTAKHKTVRRDWLYLVQTGNGIAMLRTELAKANKGNIAELGKTLLKESLTKESGKYLEEFDEHLLERAAFEMGYEHIQEAYVAIANRRLDASDLIGKMESMNKRRQQTSSNPRRITCICQFRIHSGVDSMRRLLSVYDRYNIGIKDVRFRPAMREHIRMRVRINLTPEEQHAYVQEIEAAGAQEVRLIRKQNDAWYLMSLVVVFWGINPVWARYFLDNGVSPLSLVSIRSLLFFFCTTLLYAVWRVMRRQTYAPIRRLPEIAVLPALSTFMLAIFTYLSLYSLAPSIHLTILRFNVVLLPIVYAIAKRRFPRPIEWAAIALMSVVIFSLIVLLQAPVAGTIFGFFSLIAYILYSYVSKHVQQEYKIGARYPSFLFIVGCYVGVLGLLFGATALREISLWSPYANQIFLYVVLCVFLPHTCFHLALQRLRTGDMSWVFLLEVPLAILLESLVLGLILSPATYVGIAVSAIGIALIAKKQQGGVLRLQ